MQNISRRRKQSLTLKKAKVNIGQSWPKYLLTTLLTVAFCTVFFYRLYDGGEITGFLLNISELETKNQELEKVIFENNLEIQMRTISYDKLAEEIKVIKEESTALKEDVMFYEKIVGRRQK